MKQLNKKSALTILLLVAVLSFSMFLALMPSSVKKAYADGSTLQISKTASIRLTEEPFGIRFKSSISKDEYTSNASVSGVKYGTLICPTDYLLDENNALVHDDDENGNLNLYDPNASYGENETFANYIVDVVASPKYNSDNDLYEFYGSIVNVKEQNLARPFAARSYVAIPDGNGSYTYTYSDVFSKSIYTVATYTIANKEVFDEYDETAQNYLTDMVDAVNSSSKFNSFELSIGDTSSLAVGDEINVTATVKINSSKYPNGVIELDVAPNLVGVVNGEEDSTALEYVDVNKYKVATFGDFDIKATIGKSTVKTINETDLNTNSVKLLDLDNLDNGYLTSTTSYNAGLTGKVSSLNGAQVTTVDGYETLQWTATNNAQSFIGMTAEAGKYLKDGVWVVFDMKYEQENATTVKLIASISSTKTNQWQDVYISQWRQFPGLFQRYEFHRNPSTDAILVDTIPLVEFLRFDVDGNALTGDGSYAVHKGVGEWSRYALKINADALTREDRTSFGFYFDLGGASATINIKDMRITTQAPYTLDVAEIEDNTYSDGDQITLSATPMKNGETLAGTTPTFKVVKGNSTISGNTLTVGTGESIVQASYTIGAGPLYLIREFITIKAYEYENLQVAGFDSELTYAYDEEITLSATADLGEEIGKTVEPTYELISGSAVISGNVVTNIVGETVIRATLDGLTYDINVKGQSITDLAVSFDSTKTYAYDEIVELTATATIDGVANQTVAPAYAVTSGNAVIYQLDDKFYAKPGNGDSTIKVSLAGIEQEFTFKGDTQSFMILGGATDKGLNSKALADAYLADGAGHELSYVDGRYAIGYAEASYGHTSSKGFNLKEEILALMNKECYVYIDMLVTGNGETRIPGGGTYFLDVPGTYLYGFEPNAAASGENHKWYNTDGDAVSWGDNNLKMGSRWLTIEVKAKASESPLFEISRYANWTKVWVSRIVVSEKQLITEKQAEVAQTRYLMDDYSSFDTYFFPDENQGGNYKDADSSFTWTENVAGRDAIKYESTSSTNNYIGLWLGLKHYNYSNPIMPKYTHAYVSFYVPEGDAWNTSTYFYNAWKVGLPNINQSASGTISGITYQWYDDEGNALTTAPTSILGEWVTVELIRDDTVTGANFGIARANGGYVAGYDNVVYFSDIIFSNVKLLGVDA